MLVIQDPNPRSILTWHAHSVGEILHTDGVKVAKPYISLYGVAEGILFSHSLSFLVISLLPRQLGWLHGNKLGWKTGM